MKKGNEKEVKGSGRRFHRVAPERIASIEDMRPENTKVKVTIYLDLDVINYFKERARQPNAAPYQTQINSELRAVMEREDGEPYANLVNDDRFIAAVAARVKEGAKQ